MNETMHQGNSRSTDSSSTPEPPRPAEARLIQQLRQGNPGAGHQFVRDYYPDVYRYLLYLTGRAELAEDLTQETFLQAWRGLAAFEGRASLRVWLHRIARREFLQVLRSRRPHASLEGVAELIPAPDADWVDAVELREVIRKLPVEQAEVVVLHYLHGHECGEIARIVGVNVSTIKYRLSRARLHLERELGEGDLLYLNEPSVPMRQWAWLPLDQMYALATRLSVRNEERGMRNEHGTSDTHSSLLIPRSSAREAPGPEATREENMERREFLRQAAVSAAALALPESEREVVDSRLTQKVTCAFKGMALSDLCKQLRSGTGIQITAGPSVADEKVTLFCEKRPLREVMRQLSRPFGYTWLRSGTPGEYRYELVQDLRSQLLEEELRNRDRNAALLAFEREMERYRPYLDLTPQEAEARAQSAAPDEKMLLENLARYGWGPIRMYFRLSIGDQAALRGGQTLVFSSAPRPGEPPKVGDRELPADIARGVLQGLRHWRVAVGHREDDQMGIWAGDRAAEQHPDDLPPASVPEVRARVDLSIRQSELGRFAFSGGPGVFSVSDVFKNFDVSGPDGPWAVGVSPLTLEPNNRAANARLTRDPALRARITVRPSPSCHLDPYPGPLGSPRGSGVPTHNTGDRLTTADVLEALHRASGMPIVSDYYTRLYEPEALEAQEQLLFDALSQLCDAMGQRWVKDRDWIQCRSSRFYNDRLKEVPNRLLARWAADRRQQGYLTLDDLVEIAQLSDAELDAESMAEGARALWGLGEWELARHPVLRPHLRDLAQFSPAQRQEAMSSAGLLFSRMTLAQQQLFLSRALSPEDPPLRSLDELEGATLRIDYTQPGWFEWVPGYPGPWQTWVMPMEPGRRAPRPPVRARNREAVLQALRRVDPQVRAALRESLRRDDPEWTPPADEAAEIYPTALNVTLIYIPGASHQRPIRIFSAGLVSCQWTS